LSISRFSFFPFTRRVQATAARSSDDELLAPFYSYLSREQMDVGSQSAVFRNAALDDSRPV